VSDVSWKQIGLSFLVWVATLLTVAAMLWVYTDMTFRHAFSASFGVYFAWRAMVIGRAIEQDVMGEKRTP
jgi:hypothetical protein